MKVREKLSQLNIYEVYDIKYDKAGYPHFLIYKNKQWFIVSAKHFMPVEEPVRHAKWIHMEDYDSLLDSTWICSGCKGKVITDYGDSPINHGFAHCPHCGAKMNGVE